MRKSSKDIETGMTVYDNCLIFQKCLSYHGWLCILLFGTSVKNSSFILKYNLKHCNFSLTKCYPLFFTLSNFAAHAEEYSCFVYFRHRTESLSVSILSLTIHLIIKICNHNQQKFLTWLSGIMYFGKKVKAVWARKIGSHAGGYMHTTYSCQEMQPLVWLTAAAVE